MINHLEFFVSTRSRGRTGTASRPLVFETSASTDSAIRAVVLYASLAVKPLGLSFGMLRHIPGPCDKALVNFRAANVDTFS